MGARLDKLVVKGVDAEAGALLVAADLDTPAKIRAATDEELEEVISSGQASTLRQVLPARE